MEKHLKDAMEFGKHFKDSMEFGEHLKKLGFSCKELKGGWVRWSPPSIKRRRQEEEEEEEVNLIKKRKVNEDVVVIITATYEDDTVRFELRPWSSSPMEMLLYEVGRRFGLGVECFKLKYMDQEEHHLIRLACDDDVHLCLRTFIPTPARSHIHLFVQKFI